MQGNVGTFMESTGRCQLPATDAHAPPSLPTHARPCMHTLTASATNHYWPPPPELRGVEDAWRQHHLLHRLLQCAAAASLQFYLSDSPSFILPCALQLLHVDTAFMTLREASL